jgi:ribosomal protein S12 methylthiotransferase accessory factor YcaO
MSLKASPHTSKLLYGTRPHIPANGADAGVVAIRLRDDCNRPIAGRVVLLSADRDDVTIQQPGPTNAEGLAFGYVRTAVPGQVTITGAIQPLTE